MSLLPPIFTTLKADAAVRNIAGTRIYRHGFAPQPTGDVPSAPYVTWFLVNGAPENTLSELPAVDRQTVQVDCWHSGDAGVEALALAVRDALEPYAICTGLVVDLRETETKLFRMGLQFDWLLDRVN